MPSNPWTYPELKAADALLGVGLAAAQNAATLNNQAGPPQDIPWGSIRDILMNNFSDWGLLVEVCNTDEGGTLPGGQTQDRATRTAAIALRDCAIYGGRFSASQPAAWNRLAQAALILVPVGAVSQAAINGVQALRNTALWNPVIGANDILQARSLP